MGARAAGISTLGVNALTVQVAAGTQADVRDKSVARIFTALNLSHRFRWEIIDLYADSKKLQAFLAERDSADKALVEVWEMIRLIEVESQNRGVYDPQALPADFGPDAQGRAREMFPLWWEKRHHLEKAAVAGDVATFAQVFTGARPDQCRVHFSSRTPPGRAGAGRRQS